MNEQYSIIKNGIILPFLTNDKGGVCDADMHFIPQSKHNGVWRKLGGPYEIERGQLTKSNDKVIFLGYFFRHWGHFLIDHLARAWFLLGEEVDLKDYKIVFLTKNGKGLYGNYQRFFELLGIEKEKIITVDVPTKFLEVVIPKEAKWGEDDDMCIAPFKYAASHCTLSRQFENGKFYLSREHFGDAKNKEFGESSIRKLFEENGYTVLYPETLSLDEQISIFNTADSIACVNGTIPLNAVFGSKKPKLIVLNKMSLKHRNLYEVADAMEINIDYINVYKEPIKGHPRLMGEGPFWITPTKELEDYFVVHGMKYDVVNESSLFKVLKYYWLYIEIKLKCKAIQFLRKCRDVVKISMIRIYKKL